MPHQDLFIEGQRIPSVTELLDTMDKSWLRPWYAKEELKRCIAEAAALFKEKEPDLKLLKKILTTWRARLREKDYAALGVSKKAADLGTEFHDQVERMLRGEQRKDPSDAVVPLLNEFDRFRHDWELEAVSQEEHVVSKTFVYQGTFDFLGRDNRYPGLGLWDWKTSNSISDTYGLQIALYAYAYGEQKGWTKEETWERITHGGTVRVDKRTSYLEFKVYTDLPYLFRVASSLREPYDYRNKVGAWEEDNG